MAGVTLHMPTHTYTQVYLTLAKREGGRGHRCFFLSSLESSILSKHVHTNKSTLTPPKEQTQQGLYGDVLILTHVKISPLSLPSSLSCIITLSIDPLTVQVHVAGGEEQWRSPPLGRRRIWGSGKGGGEV